MPAEEILHAAAAGDRGIFALRLAQLASGGRHLLLELLNLLDQLRDRGDIDDRELGVRRADAAEGQNADAEEHAEDGFGKTWDTS